MKPFLQLVGKDVLAHISLGAYPFLFGTTIVPILTSTLSCSPLRGEHAPTLSALKNTHKRKIMLRFPFARTFSCRQYFLHGFKQFRGNNCRKASVKPFIVMLHKAEVRPVRQHSFDGSFAKWRSFASHYTVKRQKVGERYQPVLVFTHHPLFFKYLAKCENATKFGVLKNAEQFGGSFVYFDPGFDLVAEVQQCNQEISQNAQNGGLKPEEIALKYGQLLRLAVERFIKNDLLMWDKEREFKDITQNLKQGKNKIAKLTDEDLETITNIYKYCNYSNLLHADKESPSALSELTQHIDKFVQILAKV